MKRKVFALVLVGIMLALVAVAIVSVVLELKNGTAETNTVIRAVLICAMAVITTLRVVFGFKGSSKAVRLKYEQAYKKEIRDAFSAEGQEKAKDMLMKGIELYNNNRFDKAIETLAKLIPECRTDNDHAAVLMFVALSYTDLGSPEDALAAYYDLLKFDDTRSEVWSNMGLLYTRLGKHEDAIGYLKNAVKYDSKNEYAFSKLAYAYLNIQDYENAITYAKRSLEINAKLCPAASTAAVAYKAVGDEDNSRKYYNMYVINGGNGEALRTLLDNVEAVPVEKTDGSNREE